MEEHVARNTANTRPSATAAAYPSRAGSIVITLFMMAVGSAAAVAQTTPLGSRIPHRALGEPTASGSDVGFTVHQLSFHRVAQASMATDHLLRARFQELGLEYPGREVFIRVFKHERVLQLWARSDLDEPFSLVREYPVCTVPGQLGPKSRLGDLQVPEGFYFIDKFNPESAYHLSLRVDYPNLADRMRRQPVALGSDIFIHGGCESVGCVPIEDHNIQEVYWLAAQAMDAGQRLIPVHIFPARLDPPRLRWLEETFGPEPDLLAFWQNLADGYAYFELTHRVPWVIVNADGSYGIPDPPAPGTAESEPDAGGPRSSILPVDGGLGPQLGGLGGSDH